MEKRGSAFRPVVCIETLWIVFEWIWEKGDNEIQRCKFFGYIKNDTFRYFGLE